MDNNEGKLHSNDVINQIEQIEQHLGLLKSQARVYNDKKQLLEFQYNTMINIESIFSKWSSDYMELKLKDNRQIRK